MLVVVRKVQMGRMWREGHRRRSPRISALDARKAQPSRSSVAVTKCSTTSVTSTSTSLHVEHQQKKRRPGGNGEGPASRTRAKKKRKLRPLQDVASPPSSAQQDLNSSDVQEGRQTSNEDLLKNSDQPIVQSKDSTNNGDRVTKPGQPLSALCVSLMPKKHILELVLDILQRRDTNEIFAEPVDPNEVEDYYEIIKEPMDFGTMRAKLHEGMYNSLEQFEHDVFLIPRNAMQFNSSGTIFFRQARAIDELAKKVFYVLKTDPENFELEFSGTRRRLMSRRAKDEAKRSNYSSTSKLALNSRSNSMALSVSGKPMLSSANSTVNLRPAMQVIPWCSASGITAQSDTRDVGVPFGGGDGSGSSFSEANRRCTYKPQLSILNENHSIVSTIYSNCKVLMHDIGYCKSLMLFVKDLGPKVKMIAQRKLNGWPTESNNYLYSASNLPKTPNCKNHVTTSFAQWISTSMDTSITIQNSQNLSSGDRIDMCDAYRRERSSGDKMKIGDASMEMASQVHDSTIGAVGLEALSSNDTEVVGISKSDNFQQNQNGRIQNGLHSSIANPRDLHPLFAGLNNKNKKSTKLKPEKSKMDDKSQSWHSACKVSQSNVLECRLSDSYSFSSSSWPLETLASGTSGFDQTVGSMNNLSSQYLKGYNQAVAAQVATHELGCSTGTDWSLKSSQASTTPISQFIFNLPFLRTRLDQMNPLGQKRFLQESSGGQGHIVSETYHDNPPHSSLDTLTSLALQL
ncbi:uncharacterized protein LOC110661512 isoform X3 [Hevea brasiliensis]|uniref:uncharacterized protein LOC110661512 isoform X3 n=1 Tax=Hevea brasiliensis TaxID=3981 RepID=UPI0025F5A680|nr:uncharacterized protein LOC110661512 isoform X3 [Hevea brasiliensis]